MRGQEGQPVIRITMARTVASVMRNRGGGRDEDEVRKGKGQTVKKVKKKTAGKNIMEQRVKHALAACRKGDRSISAVAKEFDVPRTTLSHLLNRGQVEWKGRGKKSKLFSHEEEQKLANYVKKRMLLGCGVTWSQLEVLALELWASVCAVNPGRAEGTNGPTRHWVRRFGTRQKLVLKATMELTKARALLTVDDLEEWQQQTEDFLFSNPDLREAMSDPDRIYNQVQSITITGGLITGVTVWNCNTG